ncbi:unnamed protein product [Diamesa serratosioi]
MEEQWTAPFCEMENILQMLNRNQKPRPPINNFYPELFTQFNNSDIVEFIGDSNTGKSFFVMEIIARIILPIEHGGKDASVVLINTDHKFSITKLVEIMHKFINFNKETSVNLNESLENSQAIDVIKSSLVKLNIIKCYNESQLENAVVQLDGLLGSNSNIVIVLIDSISTFYYTKAQEMAKVKMTLSMDGYLKNYYLKLKKYVEEFNVSIVYTRPSHFVSKRQHFIENITHKIQTTVNFIGQGQRLFKLNIRSNGRSRELNYIIDHYGIQIFQNQTRR